MYSQNRSYGNTLEESEDTQFNKSERQLNQKMFDEEPMFDNTTEKHQNDVKAPSRLQSSVYPGKSRKRDYKTSQRPPLKDSLQQSGRNGHHGYTSSNETIDKCTRYGYGNVYKSEEKWSSNENDLVNDNNHHIFGAFSSVIYGHGDKFRTHSEFDRSSVISERSDGFLNDFELQPWMDKITSGTFRKEYFDKNLLRPTLQHDSSISIQNVRRIGCIENRSVETQTQDPYTNEERNDKKTIKTGLVVILGILLIACIAGVLTWFLAKKGDDEFSVKYYIVCGEMALEHEFYPELSNSSSKKFKDLVIQFCGAITEALGKNNTEYGHLYRHCDVTKFMNGSIVAQYKLYYQYDEIPITKEKVYQDLKDSLTDIDSSLANFSDFVIIKASVSFLVEVQTFQTDPLVTGVPLITQATATTVTERKTTAMSSNLTTLLTESTTTALTTEYTTESIPTTLASEITTESDLSTFTTEDTTENTQSSLKTEVPTEDTTYTHSTEARIETSQSFTETVTDQTSTALNTREDSTPIDTTEYQTASKTMVTSEYPTTSAPAYTTKRFAQTTTMNNTEISIPITTLTNFETSESLEKTSTTLLVTTTSAEYSADVVVSPIIAIYGEITTTETCVVSPHGDWVHVTVSVENRDTSYVIGKFHSNRTFGEPASLDRFNASISSTNTEIVVYLSLDLQAPTTDMCLWDGIFTFSCSITMNDTIPTRVYNGSQIFITAPISDVTIDSNVHYNEGDKMTFNCSSKGDPNHSIVYTELVNGSTVLQTIPGPDFSSGYNYTSDNNCLADIQWSGDSPNPLTTDQNDVIVRCTVKNTLLNEIRTSEKRLNVSVVAFSELHSVS
eukprot:XP_011440712.1 PREDICTED: uncharacterized protein LOC105337610 isoform X1 [Crassostrea gigas]